MRRTAKQIAEKYKGNLDYFRKPHYLRRLRGWCFALVALGSILAALGFRYYGRQEFFNTGPLSSNHAQFANRCEVCHDQAEPDLLKVLHLDALGERVHGFSSASLKELPGEAMRHLPTAGDVRAGAAALAHLEPGKRVEGIARKFLEDTTLSKMDRACITCHEAQRLHQPQSAALGLRPVSRELSLVHAAGCASCHPEHTGPAAMKLPTSASCQSCHASAPELKQNLLLVKTDGDAPASAGEIRDLGDGVRRFLPPRQVPHQPASFLSFEQGHPRFGYESPHLRDPGAIRFNHWRHGQSDIPKVDGRALDCADCHKPGSDGAFYQPINFEQHCVKCHSLHFDPDVPTLAIPHGDPEKVRAYLRSLASQYADYALNNRNITDRAELKLFVNTQLEKLQARGMNTVKELEQRVFFTGDPPEVPGRVLTRSNKAQFFAGCAKCHEVERAEIAGAPTIQPTNLADRWLTRGPFTHLPHAHLACLDCHGAAPGSKATSDILLPAQSSCTECHRSLDGDRVEPLKIVATAEGARAELAAKQRREGGIAADCQSCHRYHAPTDADLVLELAAQAKSLSP